MRKKIVYTPKFRRQYKKIAKSSLLKKAYLDSVEAFIQDPSSVGLHPLKGRMLNKFSFEVTEDYRVVLRESEDYFTFLEIGTHEEVYRQPVKKKK